MPSNVSPGVLAAYRDGDIGETDAARKACVSIYVFRKEYEKFRSEQIKQRSKSAIAAANTFKRYCGRLGFKPDDVRELMDLWWRLHDEDGNLLRSPRRH